MVKTLARGNCQHTGWQDKCRGLLYAVLGGRHHLQVSVEAALGLKQMAVDAAWNLAAAHKVRGRSEGGKEGVAQQQRTSEVLMA